MAQEKGRLLHLPFAGPNGPNGPNGPYELMGQVMSSPVEMPTDFAMLIHPMGTGDDG